MSVSFERIITYLESKHKSLGKTAEETISIFLNELSNDPENVIHGRYRYELLASAQIISRLLPKLKDPYKLFVNFIFAFSKRLDCINENILIRAALNRILSNLLQNDNNAKEFVKFLYEHESEMPEWLLADIAGTKAIAKYHNREIRLAVWILIPYGKGLRMRSQLSSVESKYSVDDLQSPAFPVKLWAARQLRWSLSNNDLANERDKIIQGDDITSSIILDRLIKRRDRESRNKVKKPALQKLVRK